MSKAETFNTKQIVHELPRGGYLVETSVGYIQVGSPPETIKDTMTKFPRSTPQIFVLPSQLFHVDKGISIAELEFPVYFNHYLRQKKTYIVCTEEQREQFKIVLQEAIFGPEVINLANEYIDGERNVTMPNMKAEIDYFRGNRNLDDLIRFVIFRDNKVRFNNVTIKKLPTGNFLFIDEDWNTEVEVSGEINYNIIYDIGKSLPEPYNPPLAGITCLGPSHGFDPEANTSGFILWINHKGVMIDPPVNSTEWLRRSNVNPKLIDTIILTHCHADHDAGTFQKILEEGKVTIYTTETIMHSFINKYHALTRIPKQEMYELFDFVPVTIGKKYQIHGAMFYFNYALHSIPSLGFGIEFEGKTFYYSSDHLNDPEKYKELLERGILTQGRYEDLLNFPWESDLICHEAGIPPLHTRISYLNSLPKELQKKIIVYHIAAKDFPKETDLTYAQFGIENTVYYEIQPPKYEEVYKILDAVANCDIFKHFNISKAKDFISIFEKKKYPKGTKIVEKNTMGEEFYIIISGNVRVEGMEEDRIDQEESQFKRYGTYEYFGETSLILNQPRTADVIAETDVEALVIPKDKFLSLIRGTDLTEKFLRLSRIRKTGTWDVLSKSNIFRSLTSAQKTSLELIMEHKKIPKGTYIIKRDQIYDKVYIIKRGEVIILSKDNKVVYTLRSGDFCGQIYNLQKEIPSDYDFVTNDDCELYEVSRNNMILFIQDYPGVYMKLHRFYVSVAKRDV